MSDIPIIGPFIELLSKGFDFVAQRNKKTAEEEEKLKKAEPLPDIQLPKNEEK